VKVKKFKMSDGEPYAILQGSDGMPLPYPNLFVTCNHRNTSDSHNTSKAVFERIKFLYEILDFLDIDIEVRCKTGVQLNQRELELLLRYARFKVKDFREFVLLSKSGNVQPIKPNRKILKTAKATFVFNSESENKSSTIYNRITTFAEYIGWLEKLLFRSLKSDTKVKLKSKRPTKTSFDSGEYKSLTNEQVNEILEVVKPDSKRNPWSNDIHLRYRNQLLFNVFEATGARRGEVAKLKVSDIIDREGKRYLNITTQADKMDARSDRPEAKTLGRKFPVYSKLSDLLDDYIINHRSHVIGSEYQEYLFITHHLKTTNNNALSLSSIAKVFRDVSSAVGFSVSPHSFRHTWNDKFSVHADKRIAVGKTTPAKAEKDRQKLMGWTENSKMAKYYSRRYADESAFETGLELQKESSKELGNESCLGAHHE
jgi:integrase